MSKCIRYLMSDTLRSRLAALANALPKAKAGRSAYDQGIRLPSIDEFVCVLRSWQDALAPAAPRVDQGGKR